MVNYASRPSSRRERKIRLAPSRQYLPSLMALLGKERKKCPSSPTSINAVSTWSDMECGMSSPFHTHAIKRRSRIFFYISLYFPWDTWNIMYRVFRKSLRHISMWLRTWCGQDNTWWVLCQILFIRRYWHWLCWQKLDMRSLSPPRLHLSQTIIMIWKRLLPKWIVSN